MPSPLAALSPLDGRYSRSADPLRAYFSEQALIRYRTRIELEWLQALAAERAIKELRPFSPKTVKAFSSLTSHFSEKDAEQIKSKLGLFDGAWNGFLAKIAALTNRKLTPADAASYFQTLFPQKDGRPLSPRVQNEIATMLALYSGAPGQDFTSAKGTLWGAVNAVTYYVDHVRASAVDRLDSAWFGAGNALKDRAWAAAVSAVIG